MITLVDSVRIEANPGEVERWLLEIEGHYREWHPEHVKWVNLDGELAEGRRFYYEEYFKGRLYRSRCLITRIERDGSTLIEFKGLSLVDRIGGVSGSFRIEPDGGGCVVTATINLRPGWLARLIGLAQAIERHMEEEGANLKRLLEGGDC